MRLDDEALIETARSKSQAHLMAISTRKALSGAVTDVLVLRGNDEVIQSTVNNPGAEFTERGFTRLVNRAEGDDDLATCIGIASDHSAASLPETAGEGIGDGAAAARGRQPAAGQGSPDRGARGDATRALRARRRHAGNGDRPRAGQIALRGRPARRIPGGRICRGRQVRRNQCLDRGARQCVGIDRREHDDRNPRRGRDDPGQGRGVCRGRR